MRAPMQQKRYKDVGGPVDSDALCIDVVQELWQTEDTDLYEVITRDCVDFKF